MHLSFGRAPWRDRVWLELTPAAIAARCPVSLMSSESKSQRSPLAVVGVSALFPGSTTSTGFWRNILEGQDLISDVPASHWLVEDYYDPDPTAPDKTYANRGGFLPKVDFDAMGWGVPPSIIPATDTSQLLALIVAEQVLRDATRSQFDTISRERMSVILGVTSAQELLATMVSRLQRPVWVKALREQGFGEDEVQAVANRIGDHYQPWQESSFPGLLGNVVAGRIANRMDLGGTNCVTDAACASTFSAIAMAANELYLGDSDLVIAGGVDTLNDIFMYMCFSKTPALSPTGDCRPFSDQADGTMLGEGLGMVALKRLEDAVRDEDRIYCVLSAVGSSSDGRSKSVYAPVSEGQAKALRRAYERAGFSARTVELVEAHGTGTKAGDAAEFNGLKLAFEESDAEKQWCALGSVKSQIGHTKAAAGAGGLFKAIMALHAKSLPPTIKVERPNPKLELESSPFYINTLARPWVRPSDHPRRAAVSSFGFGGSNFHLALEEYDGPLKAERLRSVSWELITLSGKDGAEVAALARDFAGRANEGMLPRLAYDSHVLFLADAPARLAIVATSEADLKRKLERAAATIEKAPSQAFEMPDGTVYGLNRVEGDVAFIFPGQGSQYTNMGAHVAMSFDSAIRAWDNAAFDFGTGKRLDQVVFPIPKFTDEDRASDEDFLRSTEWAQPAIGVCSISMLNLMRDLGVAPSAFAGHSFGEVTALYAAGVLSESDMLQVARKRGELMAAASELPGAMSAVAATLEAVEAVLAEVGSSDVVMANHNAPDQVVISGTIEAVKKAEALFEARGITVKSLPVSTAFHSPVVSASSKPFGEFLDTVRFEGAQTPVWSGESTEVYEVDPKAMRARLARQISNPVRFVDTINNMYNAGVRTFVEVGPGSVLTKLVGGILAGKEHTAVSLDRRGKHGLEFFLRGLGALSVSGVQLDFEALWKGYAVPEDVNTRVKPKLSVKIDGSNVGKLYPPEGGAAALPKPNPTRQPEVIEREVRVEVPVEVVREVQVEVPVYVQGPAGQGAPNQQPPASSEWIATWQEAHRQNAMSLMAFQHAMTQSQTSFIQAIETSYRSLGQEGGQQPAFRPSPAPAFPAYSAPLAAPAPTMNYQAPVADNGGFKLPNTTPTVAPTAPVSPRPAPAVAVTGSDIETAMLRVVSQKTGYPIEMLDMTMDLEGDLGVDSIKRVEILAALQDATPGLPDADASQMGGLRTLGDIVQFLRNLLGPQSANAPIANAPVASVAAPVAQPVSAPVQQAAGPDLHALMLKAVSEKTGYPEEMLEVGMDLEGDLGIDSIKRVEILAAVQEQAPGMPDVDTNRMGALKTLGEIVDYMQGLMGTVAPTAVAAPAVVVVPTAPAGPAVDLHALMFAAVSEKTGYPAEMLELSMDLEGDLGIDSIKRVEILAAVQEQAPGMPDVDTNRMGALRTLGEIVDYMQGLMGSVSVSAPVSSAPHTSVAAPQNAAPGVDLHALMLAAVAEKTGYPAEMLELGMDLEGDLGIDSIKRVEILAAVQEQAPGMPDVDTNKMSALRTLGEIVQYMQGLMGGAAPAPVVTPVPTAVLQKSSPGVDLHALMLAAVAEKTGYPAEMLELEMDLEGDLGIDSIKRVEILAAVQEQAPGMPDVDTNKMSVLRTLGQIVEYMQGLMGGAPQAVASAPAPVQVVEASPALGRFSLKMVERKPAGLAQPHLFGSTVLITDDGGGVAQALAIALTKSGVEALVVKQVPAGANSIIFLGGLASISSAEEGMEIEKNAFRMAKALAPKIKDGGLFVTVQDTGGAFGTTDFDPVYAYVGGLPGLVKTAAQEWPEASLKAIDIQREGRTTEQVAEAIADELLRGGVEIEVGLPSNGTRICPVSVADDVTPGNARINKGDVVVVSGGARGVTAACVVEWAKQSGANFVLLGRTPLEDEPAAYASAKTDADLKRVLLAEAKEKGEALTPATLSRRVSKVLANREVKSTLEAVKLAGGQARYVAADVVDTESLNAAFEDVRKNWGPIKALVHGAGVLADKFIADMSEDDFDFVFDTKVQGYRALMGALKSDPIQVICLFSSVAGRCGNSGQANYSMANEVLNKIAQAEQDVNPEILVKSLGWGPWEGGMVSPELKAHFDRMGVPMIPLHVGAKMFADEMSSGNADQVELVMGGEPRAAALLGGKERPFKLEVNVNHKTHGFLRGHSIAGAAVIPVVLVLEWFSRIARAAMPDLHLTVIKNLKVLKGIRLTDFEGAGDRFILTCWPVANGSDLTLQLELHSATGALHYRAMAEMSSNPTKMPVNTLQTPALNQWGSAKVYGDVLFHTDDFQVIKEMEGISDVGIAGALKGVHEAKWTWDAWQTDVAAMDGGLQMLLLWAREGMGGAVLPMGIGELRFSQEAPTQGEVRCVANCKTSGSTSAVADLLFTDAAGLTLAEMKHVELILRPDVKA